MGYTTDFDGSFEFNKTLDDETFNFLKQFADEDHEDGDAPSTWCQWIPTEDRKYLEWDGNEKFYEYIEWLKYLIEKFLKPKGYILNGEVGWSGEEQGDVGFIIVKNNVVTTQEGKIIYEEEKGIDIHKEIENLLKEKREKGIDELNEEARDLCIFIEEARRDLE